MDMYHLQFPLNVWIWGYFKGFSKKVILKVILKVQAIFDAVVTIINTAWKVFKYGVISCPYFPVFGLNTEIYFVDSRIQSEYRKIRTRNNSVFGDFSRSVASPVFCSYWKPAVFQPFYFLGAGKLCKPCEHIL